MNRLSRTTLISINKGVETPEYDRDNTGIGIVHFGAGAFHQAHQAVFTDEAMAHSGGDWGICGVSLNSPGSQNRLAPQDGLFTLATCDKISTFRVIGSVKEILFAGHDRDTILTRLCAPSTKIVTLTITEKGYALSSAGQLDLTNPLIRSDIRMPEAPVSAMGYIILAAKRRRDAGLLPLTVISCDNLPANGDKLKAACIQLSQQTNADLAPFIATMRFPNTMVDSITPATNKEVLDQVRDSIGLEDHGAVQREAFAQWVIEDNLPDDHPDWAHAGATITNDVHGFEMTKLRILNGAHSSLTYLGLLANLECVEDVISQSELRNFVDKMIKHETIPTITAPVGLDLVNYWTQTISRFENPHIRHLIEQISHDGSQKIPARIVPVVSYHANRGSVATCACFVIAAWIVWNRECRTSNQAPIDAYLDQTADRLPHSKVSLENYIDAFLNRNDIFPDEFRNNSSVRQSIQVAATKITSMGVIVAVRNYLT